jgi:hypothetical protein
VIRVKVAVTDLAASMVAVQVPVPEHPAPDQPAKVEVASGVAVSTTAVPVSYVAVQLAPQLIPAGAEATVPPPVPARLTESAWVIRAKVAVTDAAASTVTVQVPVPEHPAPDQPAKVEVASGVAVSTTAVLASKVAVHVVPQSIPAGVEATVPPPVPARTTVSWCVIRVKVAVTDRAPSMETAQSAFPEQSPVQPAKVEVASGVAVSATDDPVGKEAAQVAPQSIPAGVEATVPPPVPSREMVSG